MKTHSSVKRRFARPGFFQGNLLLALVAAAVANAPAQQPEQATMVRPLSREVESCKTNLNRLFEAIQEYRKVHDKWPDLLSDLHPDFILDLNTFICPVVPHKGGIRPEQPGLRTGVFEDPVPNTYSYEFKPKVYPLWAGCSSTDREFKVRQMKVLGSNVPIVRCIQHQPNVFLSVGGTIFESSGTDWEAVFKDWVDIYDLYPDRIFRDLAPRAGRFTDRIRRRDPITDSNLVDLSHHYTSAMHMPWLWRNPPGVDLSELPQGVVTLPGISASFDVRGVIQLNARNMISPFPTRADGIAVKAKGRFLHFLESAVRGEKKTSPLDQHGTEVGRYEIQYSDGQHLSIPIRYGIDVLEWNHPEAVPAADGPRIAWEGKDLVSRGKNRRLRLYHQRWNNPRPDIAIQSFDFVSGMAGVAPFLIAVTLEP